MKIIDSAVMPDGTKIQLEDWHCPTFKDQRTGKMMYDCAFQWYKN